MKPQQLRRPTSIFPTALISFALVLLAMVPARAVPTLTVANGVTNPPPNLTSTGLNPSQTEVALTASVVSEANMNNLIQTVLTAQGFAGSNGWSLANNAVSLDPNATFNLTIYSNYMNTAGTAFGQAVNFTNSPNLTGPPTAAGSTNTIHWLQLLNESTKVNNYGFAINGQPGFWKYDNGNASGGPASGPGTGPYYDSNAPQGFSTPPGFFDSPHFYSGVGFYFYADVFPVWDVYTPASGGNPATETIDIGDYGVQWGFLIVPEPSSISMIFLGLFAVGIVLRRGRKA
ncbi:MAG: hypothetical protein C5B50_20325 [Verrucomicrobia bacterium]|nr:MAG: hypothetical protein C5B50_20325 [Verrucomicrobiota bacterium]